MSKSDGQVRPWRQVAQELAEEQDPNRVTELAKELTEALDAQGPRLDVSPGELKQSNPVSKRSDASD